MSSSGTPEANAGRITRIAVAMKWSPLHVEVDPVTGMVAADQRLFGPSPADQAALECALRLAEARRIAAPESSGAGILPAAEVIAIAAGPPEAEAMLRMALAAGATYAVRCALDPEAPSEKVAEALCGALSDASLVMCGDRSLDRGSGSVPAFIAARLNIAQALGLVALHPEGLGVLIGERRLGGGRRERLRIRLPAVISVEPGVARLRRASLSALLDARSMPIQQLSMVAGRERHEAGPSGPGGPPLRPYRPRTRVAVAPDSSCSARERIIAISGILGDRAGSSNGTYNAPLQLPPSEAAERILAQLRAWGYLD